MSTMIRDVAKINLTTGEKFGIKLGGKVLELPIKLQDERQVDLLLKQLRGLGYEVETNPGWVSPNPAYSHPARITASKKEHWYSSTHRVIIGKGNSMHIEAYYGDSAELSMIDTILRHTILGDGIVEYWMKTYGDSKEGAQKRRDDLTPLAREGSLK
ncbi:MAG: hypothetical protein KGI04_00265 [Candidatus Micrarchaeota archaeon]|nr:hypothetical protein [Candidatus Micrarchaeota archaeon]